ATPPDEKSNPPRKRTSATKALLVRRDDRVCPLWLRLTMARVRQTRHSRLANPLRSDRLSGYCLNLERVPVFRCLCPTPFPSAASPEPGVKYAPLSNINIKRFFVC